MKPADANAVIDAVFGDIADADATTFNVVSFGGGDGYNGSSGGICGGKIGS